jgi:hypothetical protein
VPVPCRRHCGRASASRAAPATARGAVLPRTVARLLEWLVLHLKRNLTASRAAQLLNFGQFPPTPRQSLAWRVNLMVSKFTRIKPNTLLH